MSLKNAKTLPKVFYGLHMCEGLAEYKEPEVNGGNPYRIFIGEDTLKNMDGTFRGRPVYVQHVDGVDLEKLQEEADGYVVKSFFNQLDGKHWVQFMVVSDRGHEAVAKGWRLSNAYIPKEMGVGGVYHAIDYQKEVTRGEYEHLAIVPNPRYDESIILTPEEFEAYNSKKELALKRFANSKGEKSMFNFFKKTAVENGAEFENATITLPLSKKEMTVSAVINAYDSSMMPDHMANGEHHVMVGEEKMTVNDLVMKHLALKASAAEKTPEKESTEEKPKEDKPADEVEAKQNKEKDEDGDEDGDEPAKKNEADLKAEQEAKDKEKLINQAHFEALKDAPMTPIKNSEAIDLTMDRVARGKSRYGSGK